MRLIIPFTGTTLLIEMERTRPTSRLRRMSLRTMMVAIALFAFLAWVGKEAAVRSRLGTEFTKTYVVSDLLSGPPTIAELMAFAEVLKASVPRDEWWSGKRSVTPFVLDCSMIIRDTEAGHSRVQAWLQERRAQPKGHAN